jgi:hypothetical protein
MSLFCHPCVVPGDILVIVWQSEIKVENGVLSLCRYGQPSISESSIFAITLVWFRCIIVYEHDVYMVLSRVYIPNEFGNF